MTNQRTFPLLALIALLFLLITSAMGQTITVTSTSSTTVSSSAGGSCTVANKASGNGSFNWTCGPTATGTPTQTGAFTQTPGTQDFLWWTVSDLSCIVAVNATVAVWGVNPNSTGTPTFAIPANSVGMMCISRSAPNPTPSNLVIQ